MKPRIETQEAPGAQMEPQPLTPGMRVVVGLEIQRETGWDPIPGSSWKGTITAMPSSDREQDRREQDGCVNVAPDLSPDTPPPFVVNGHGTKHPHLVQPGKQYEIKLEDPPETVVVRLVVNAIKAVVPGQRKAEEADPESP
jgi:hypothetical protein